MIEEIVYSPDFERLADDAFANYVVQTAVSIGMALRRVHRADKILKVGLRRARRRGDLG